MPNAPLTLELLVRVYDAGKCERFTLREVCPRDPSRFLCALDELLERGLVERVSGGRCGVWWYRLTATGWQAGQAGELPVPNREYGGEEIERRAVFASGCGGGSRRMKPGSVTNG